MSRRGERRKQPRFYRTSAEQLLKCYGAINSGKSRNTESERVRTHTSSDSSTVTCSSQSRHKEQHLRPRTCIACQACVTTNLHNSEKQSAVPKLQPLSRTNHFPYYSGRANKGWTNIRSRSTERKQISDSRKLISCHFEPPRSVPGSTSSKSSGLSDIKMPSPPEDPLPWPSALPSVSSLCVGVHLSDPCDPELRKWIVEFGGDERAAFMARGLQKLQLAHERGKLEMDQRTPSRCVNIS